MASVGPIASRYLWTFVESQYTSKVPDPTGALAPDGTPANLSGAFSLAYFEPDGTEITEDAPFAYDETPLTDGRWFVQRGTDRTVALALLVEAMHDAALDYKDQPALAQKQMEAAVARISADAERLGDEDLAVEVELASSMLQLVTARAPQGTLYGQ